MGRSGITNNWSKGNTCPQCGGPMSNESKYSCRPCTNKNAETESLCAFSTDWSLDSLGIWTRFHGDV